MGGYLGFQIYLDNNQEWLMDMLRYDEDEGLEEIEAEEDEILGEEDEEDFDLDMFGEGDDDELGFEDADIDISDVRKGFAGFGGGDALFSVHSIGIDVGMYGPSMSYWNDEFIKDDYLHASLPDSLGISFNGEMTKFAMAPLFQGSATFKLGSKIRISLSGGMWSGSGTAKNLVAYRNNIAEFGSDIIVAPDTVFGFAATDLYDGMVPQEDVDGDGELDHPYAGMANYGVTKLANTTKEIAVTMMPTTAIVSYEIFGGLYVGAGIGANSITQEITDKYTNWIATDGASTPETWGPLPAKETQSFSGSGSRTIVCVGYELPLGPLAVGLQGNYVLGKYDQEMSDGYGTKDREVGTDGIQFLVNLGYRFGE
jgi:hypothetical protein